MGEHLGLVLGPAERLDPLGGAPVLLRPLRTRDLPVGDVADQHVPERVLRLAGDRRCARTLDELLALERVKSSSSACQRVTPSTACDRAEPEHLPDDGRVLEQPLLRFGERVEPRGDDPLHRLGQLDDVAALGEHARVLLGVQRVAAGAREQLRPASRASSSGSLEQRVDEPRGVLVGERRRARSVSAFGLPPPQPAGAAAARAARSRARAAARRWRARRAGRRSRAARRRPSADPRTRARAGAPRRAPRGTGARRRTPRPAPGRRRPPRGPTSGRRCALEPAAPRRRRRRPRDRVVELLLGLLGGVALEDAGLRLDDLGQRPERDALAVGERPALAPAHAARRRSTAVGRARRRAGSCRCRARRRASRAAASAPRARARASTRAARARGARPTSGAGRAPRDVDAEARAARSTRLPDGGPAPPCPSPTTGSASRYSIASRGRAVASARRRARRSAARPPAAARRC